MATAVKNPVVKGRKVSVPVESGKKPLAKAAPPKLVQMVKVMVIREVKGWRPGAGVQTATVRLAEISIPVDTVWGKEETVLIPKEAAANLGPIVEGLNRRTHLEGCVVIRDMQMTARSPEAARMQYAQASGCSVDMVTAEEFGGVGQYMVKQWGKPGEVDTSKPLAFR